MRKAYQCYIATAAGLFLVALGLYLVKTVIEPQGILKALPYVLIGLGCGIFGHGMGEWISRRAMKKHPEIEKRMQIEKGDERNIAIANFAKAKAYDMMIFLFGAILLVYALMGVDMVAILLFVFAYLFVVGYGVYYRVKYEKEM